jgi:hypothetical protein
MSLTLSNHIQYFENWSKDNPERMIEVVYGVKPFVPTHGGCMLFKNAVLQYEGKIVPSFSQLVNDRVGKLEIEKDPSSWLKECWDGVWTSDVDWSIEFEGGVDAVASPNGILLLRGCYLSRRHVDLGAGLSYLSPLSAEETIKIWIVSKEPIDWYVFTKLINLVMGKDLHVKIHN